MRPAGQAGVEPERTGRGAGTSFVVDHMVIKLGKYLRVLGYDAVWDSRLRTHELIQWANREGRVFVTRNGRLKDQYPAAQRVLQVVSSEPVAQLRAVQAAYHLDPRQALFTCCIRCNVPLVPVGDKEAVRGRVHPRVFARQSHFFSCPVCGTVFWRGSHVRNTCCKLGLPVPDDTAPARPPG
ncbi:MAG: Mut7-C RNAse domain-containing protein [Lentisphaerae bacterium]|nr:Mut7-C RNAse domain-containing protein [Lentisphaerota bacterium]